jgi:predicted deacetylase
VNERDGARPAVSACPLFRSGDPTVVPRALVISIHDVAPVTRARVEQMLAQLSDAGVSHCSLLVVPDYHHSGRSLREPAFVGWLRELSVRGHEIVLHGFYHQRARQSGESARQKVITRVYTADEGEFYDLDYKEALRLLHEARDEFAAQGLHPRGFIAPAWLLGAEAERAAIDAGFGYTTTLQGVRDFASGEEFPSQSLVYSTRSDWRCAVSLFWNRMLFRWLTSNPLLRLSLHPPDVDHAGIWRQILALTRKAVRDRRPTTYQEWLRQESKFRIPKPELA